MLKQVESQSNYPSPLTTSQNQWLLLLVNACTTQPSTWASTSNYHDTNHVDAVTKKANCTLAFLRRNTSNCSRPVKAYCYQTYVRLNIGVRFICVGSCHQKEHRQTGESAVVCCQICIQQLAMPEQSYQDDTTTSVAAPEHLSEGYRGHPFQLIHTYIYISFSVFMQNLPMYRSWLALVWLCSDI